MDHSFQQNLGGIDEEMLKYIGVTNLDFRTNLSEDDLNEVQKILFSINTLMQVTFKDGVSVENIEKIKHMIELSPTCNDKKIEKMILKKNDSSDITKILALSFLNPDTWSIAYQIKDSSYMITSLPNYKMMEEYINIVLSCIKDSMSDLEKIKEVYDFVKLLEFDINGSSRLPDIIKTRKTNSLGFNLLFKEILDRLGFNSCIGEVLRENNIDYITIVEIEDKKYNVNGIYLFDSLSDSLPKELYKSNAIRKINYNFFGLTLNQLKNTNDMDKLLGILDLFTIDSFDYFNRKLDDKNKKMLEENFKCGCFDLFRKIKNTRLISDETLFNLIFSNIHMEDFLDLNRNVEELIKNNYNLRKKEIFHSIESADLLKISVHDI